MLKTRGFLGHLKCQFLYNDRIRHVDEEIDKKMGFKLQIYYRPVLEKRQALRKFPNSGKFTNLLHSKRLHLRLKPLIFSFIVNL